MFGAVLDTCVLWPSLQRDFLLTLATRNLYQPYWSAQSLEELEYCEREKLIHRGASVSQATQRASRLVLRIREAFDSSLVRETEAWNRPFGLPDPDDEHVVIAAKLSDSGAIVTDNVKDFPPELMPVGVEIKTARQFIADVVDINPLIAFAALTEMLSRYNNPPMSIDECLSELENRYGLIEATIQLRQVQASSHNETP